MAVPLADHGLDRYEERQSGYRERFSTPSIGGGRTVVVTAEPVEGSAPVTWVVVHSFGPEHENLAAFNAMLCRALASAGHGAIRFHSQGHGDSELGPDSLGVERQVAGALDAVRLARSGASTVGLIGVRFGGAIAALATARIESCPLVLIDPVVKGRTYLRSLVRLDRTTEISLGSAVADAGDPFQRARAEGMLEIEGFAVPWPAVVEIEELDLLKIPVLEGPALVMQVSRSDAPRDELRRLTENLGPGAVLDIVVNKDALRFGLPPWRLAGAHDKVDSLAGLASVVVERSVRWCVQEVQPRG